MSSAEGDARTIRYRDASRRERRHFGVITAVVAVVVLAGLAVVADLSLRAWGEQRISDEVSASLPEGVDGDVDAQIGGFSVILQYLSGRFEQIDLRSDGLTVQGVPIDADVRLEGVPTDTSAAVSTASGSVELDQAALAALLAAQGVEGDVALGDDSLEYTATAEVLGQSLEFTLDTLPVVDAGRIVFEPQQATVALGGLTLDAGPLLDEVAPEGVAVCVARFLPRDVRLDSVDVGDGGAIARLSGEQLLLGELQTTGNCPTA